jgi:hypothetical protein
LYECESWSLTLREEHSLRMFENRVLRRIFGPKREELSGGCRWLHDEELHNLYPSPNIIKMIKWGMGGACSICYWWYIHTNFLSENFKGRDHAEDLSVDKRIVLKWILGKYDGKVWTASVWLRMETSGWLLLSRQWTFGFHKMWVISWLTNWLLSSQEWVCSMELLVGWLIDCLVS